MAMREGNETKKRFKRSAVYQTINLHSPKLNGTKFNDTFSFFLMSVDVQFVPAFNRVVLIFGSNTVTLNSLQMQQQSLKL